MAKPDQPQPLTFVEALIPVVSLILLVALSFYLFGDAGAKGPNQVALVMATMIAVFIGWRRDFTLDELREAAVEHWLGPRCDLYPVGRRLVDRHLGAVSGTLLAMVYYGLQMLSLNYFYVTAAALCAIVSFSIGSSWTAVGTIGIGLMGISLAWDSIRRLPPRAMISGSYFGDTTSPLSDSANLAAAAAGADLYQHIRETVLTSVLALAIALSVFWTLGSPGDFDASGKIAAIEELVPHFARLFRATGPGRRSCADSIPAIHLDLAGALVGGVLAVIVAPERVVAFAAGRRTPTWLAAMKGVWLALASGYKSSTGIAAIDGWSSRAAWPAC